MSIQGTTSIGLEVAEKRFRLRIAWDTYDEVDVVCHHADGKEMPTAMPCRLLELSPKHLGLWQT
jgi:hypothetical protein